MATARFVIKGENQLKGTLNDAKQDINGFQSAVSNAGSMLAKAFTVTAVVAGLKQLGSTIKDVANEGSQFQAAIGNLQTALGANDKEMKEFTKSLNKLDDQTKANRLDLIGYAQSFKAFDLSTQQVEKLLQASINLSNVTGQDLSTAINAVQKSLTGSTSALKKMGVEVGTLTTAQLKNGDVADILIKKYGELSDAMQIGDSQQTLNNISDTLTRIKQDLGEGIIDAISPALETLYGWLLKIEEWAEGQNEKRKNSPYTDAVDMVGRTKIGYLANLYGVSGEDIISAYNGVDRYDRTMRGNVQSYIGSDIKSEIMLWQTAMSKAQSEYVKIHGIPDLTTPVIKNPGFGTNEGAYSIATDAFGRNPLADVTMLAEDVIYKMFTAAEESVKEVVGNTNWDYVKTFGIGDSKAGFGEKPFPLVNPFGRSALELPINEVSQATLDRMFDTPETNVDLTKRTSRFGTDFDFFSGINAFGKDGLLYNGINSNHKQGSDLDMLSFVLGEMGSGLKETVTGLASFKAILDPLNTVFGAFTAEIGNLVGQLLQPLHETLEWIGTALADTLVPIFSALMPAIQGIVTIIKSVLTPVLDGLAWIFEQVGAGLQLITGTIQWAADCIRYGIGMVTFWTSADDVARPGALKDYTLNGGFSAGSITAATQVSVASAAYAGGNNITINIYQSGAVVGDSGMREFAQMIKNEFDNLNYYGVA